MRAQFRSISAVGGILLVGVAGAAGAAGKSATFNIIAVHSAPGQEVTIRSKCWVTQTHGKAEVSDPIKGSGIVLLSGDYGYFLDPKEKKGIRTPLPAEVKSSKDRFDWLIRQITFDATKALSQAKVVRTETVAGYPCDVYSNAQSKGEESRSMTVWVPKKMSPRFPVKGVMSRTLSKPGLTQKSGVTITLSNIKLNAAIPASTFAVPSGYKIIDPPKEGAGAPKAPKK